VGCGTSARNNGAAPVSRYCAVCGRPADGTIRRAGEVFCSEAHAEEFAREVAALRAAREADR